MLACHSYVLLACCSTPFLCMASMLGVHEHVGHGPARVLSLEVSTYRCL